MNQDRCRGNSWETNLDSVRAGLAAKGQYTPSLVPLHQSTATFGTQ